MSNGHTEHCGIGRRRLEVDVRQAVGRDPTVTGSVVDQVPIADLVGGRILESEDRTANAGPPYPRETLSSACDFSICSQCARVLTGHYDGSI